MTTIQKQERAAAVEVMAERMNNGVDFTAGDTMAFDHQFGDEGPGSHTHFSAFPVDAEMVAEAERLLRKWRREDEDNYEATPDPCEIPHHIEYPEPPSSEYLGYADDDAAFRG